MTLNPQIIGKTMPHGFAGSYARQPDMIINTRKAGGTEAILFGAPLMYDANKAVVTADATVTAETFVGVAGREVKSALSYLDQSVGQYAAGEAVCVFMRGSINVHVPDGTPELGGAVYIRTKENETYANSKVGDFSATDDTGNVVKLTNCQWGGSADANGIAELVILTRANA